MVLISGSNQVHRRKANNYYYFFFYIRKEILSNSVKKTKKTRKSILNHRLELGSLCESPLFSPSFTVHTCLTPPPPLPPSSPLTYEQAGPALCQPRDVQVEVLGPLAEYGRADGELLQLALRLQLLQPQQHVEAGAHVGGCQHLGTGVGGGDSKIRYKINFLTKCIYMIAIS